MLEVLILKFVFRLKQWISLLEVRLFFFRIPKLLLEDPLIDYHLLYQKNFENHQFLNYGFFLLIILFSRTSHLWFFYLIAFHFLMSFQGASFDSRLCLFHLGTQFEDFE